MTKPKTKYPIESFGPELMEALLKAGRGEQVIINFPTRKLAQRFQMRLHMLRQRMRETDHSNWKIAYQARTSLKWEGGPDDPATVTISRTDSEFADVLSKAKITAPKLDDDSGGGDILDEV